jgi:TfoX/Sxy family transcriptional regulator of competence genes
MATSQATIDYILDQLTALPQVSARKMFGEYALYVGSKVVALVCDDTLFVKITEAGKEHLGESYEEGCAYDGAKPSMVISEELIEDRQWLAELFELTAEHLPEPRPKKKVVKKRKG